MLLSSLLSKFTSRQGSVPLRVPQFRDDTQEVRLYKYLNRTPDVYVSRVWAAIIKVSIKIRRTYFLALSFSFFSLSLQM